MERAVKDGSIRNLAGNVPYWLRHPNDCWLYHCSSDCIQAEEERCYCLPKESEGGEGVAENGTNTGIFALL